MWNLVVFGIGKVGKSIIQQLKSKYNILFVVDNDKNKWGTQFEGYMVKSPSEIQQYNDDIVITSYKYAVEILSQLQNMGVDKDRIYWCRRIKKINMTKYEICPAESQSLRVKDKKLIQYDLFHKEEVKTDGIKVMIFSTAFSVYVKQLIENMAQRYDDVKFSLLTEAKDYERGVKQEYLNHIYCFESLSDLRTILEQLPMYDAMQLLWIEREWSYFYELIRSRTKLLNLNVGGSDFYRASEEERDFKRKLIACADKVSAEVRGTVQEFKEYYREEVGNKIELLPFGIEVLDYIKLFRNQDKSELKKKYNIPLNKIIIICAHNAFKENRHLELIEVLDKLTDKKKQEIICVFPMTYPNNMEEYICEVEDMLRESGLDYLVMTEFMDFQAMAEIALIADIMVRIQTTDQLSSMMLEAMYAGSIVIAGSWLPYQSLHDMGIFFLDVDTIPEVTTALEDVVTNIENYKEKCRGNSEIVWNHSSWDVLAPKWRALWD